MNRRALSEGAYLEKIFVMDKYYPMEVVTFNGPNDDSGTDAVLRQRAEPVKPINAEIVKIAEEMIEIMHQSKGVGLAGPQVGLKKRIFVIHIEGDVPRVFINPSIVATSQETVKLEEGCLSLPGIWADVTRPESVRVQAWNEKGRPFTIETDGILARVILHEYDHLEGTLFIDRLLESKRNKILAKLEKRQQLTT